MKKILFVAIAFTCFAFTTKAQMLSNLTNCDIDITQTCYDATCTAVSVNVYTLIPGQVIGANMCAPDETVYDVCWSSNPCGTTPVCVSLAGDNPAGPCGSGAYIGSIISCPQCTSNALGIATVVVDPTTGDVTVFP